jgi:hypothetical protein
MDDFAYACVLDASGDLYVTGYTQSADFPVAGAPYDGSHNGGQDAFVSRLSPDLNSLMFSAFYGGGGEESGSWGLGPGNRLGSGRTDSSDLPTTPGAYDTTHNGGFDAFISLFYPRVRTMRVIGGRAANLEE